MITKRQSISLAFSLLLLGQVAVALPTAQAGDFSLNNTVDTTKSGDAAGDANYGRHRFTLTFDSRFGYDDNTLGQPDTATVQVGTTAAGKPVYKTFDQDQTDSAFLNFALSGGYTAANPRLSLTLGGDVGVNYFFDRPGRSYDVNGGFSLRLTYRASPRLLLEASSYNVYESQGDYGATNLSGFTGQFNGVTTTPGTTAQRNGDYFYTTDYLAATYQFTPRFSTVLSNTLVAFAYDDEPYSTLEDRIEEYIQLEGRYLVRPTLSLAVDYRFGYIDYFGVSNDSYTSFALAGFDYTFNSRLRGTVRAGVEFRRYVDTVGNEDSPYATASLTYELSRYSHIAVVASYGIQEGDLSANNSKADTLSLGVSYEQNFTARISGYLNFNYNHAVYQTPVPKDPVDTIYNTNGFVEDTLDVAVGGRYAFNRHVSAEIGYTHTTVLSDVDVRAYDRNRVFAGIRLAY